MRDLLLGYPSRQAAGATSQQAHVIQAALRRERLDRRHGSGRATFRRPFHLEAHLLSTVETASETAAAGHGEARERSAEGGRPSGVKMEAPFEGRAAGRKSSVFKSKRRGRILDRKGGTGRSTTLRLFPLEAQALSPQGQGVRVEETADHGNTNTNIDNVIVDHEDDRTLHAGPTSMEIVPYFGDGRSGFAEDAKAAEQEQEQSMMELDAVAEMEEEDDGGACSSPDAGFADMAPCFEDEDPYGAVDLQPEEVGPAAVVGEVVALRAKRPKGEPNKRLKNWAKSRKSLAPHGLQVNEETGLRRSTRRKCKPLQWWRNEKVEYERQHRTLPTIATVALRSPDEFWPAPSKRKTKSRIPQLSSHASP